MSRFTLGISLTNCRRWGWTFRLKFITPLDPFSDPQGTLPVRRTARRVPLPAPTGFLPLLRRPAPRGGQAEGWALPALQPGPPGQRAGATGPLHGYGTTNLHPHTCGHQQGTHGVIQRKACKDALILNIDPIYVPIYADPKHRSDLCLGSGHLYIFT